MAWSDAARKASAEMRRLRAKGKVWKQGSSINHAKSLIAAHRKVGGYVKISDLLKESGLTSGQAQRALHVLMGRKGSAAGWQVYTEKPFAGDRVVLTTPSGARIGRLLLRKR